MPARSSPTVFISFAHKDGARLARRLQQDLQRLGFGTWLDARRLVGGSEWAADIEQAIDASEVVLALMTAGSYASEICRSEQLRALRKGKRVIPLLVDSAGDIPLFLEAKQYRDFTRLPSYSPQFKLLIKDIRHSRGVLLREDYAATSVTYITAPPTVVNYMERSRPLRALREALFVDRDRQPLAVTAVGGMGGIGKTVLASALTRDKVVQDAFPDGIVWVTIGRERADDPIVHLNEIARALGDSQSYDSLSSAVHRYRALLAQKAVLIVLDDVWSRSDLEPFIADSPRSRLLFTTRDTGIAKFIGAREHSVDLLNIEESRDLLRLWAGLPATPWPSLADSIIRECGNLPLALSVVGAMLRDATQPEWAEMLRLLRDVDLSAIADQLPPGQDSFFRTVEVSFNSLTPQMQARYKVLAVLLEDMDAPLPILETLWNVNQAEARRISKYFVERSLAQFQEDRALRLHDLQLDYLHALYEDQNALRLIHGAVRLSVDVLRNDPPQFSSQMLGRLLAHTDVAAVDSFTASLATGSPAPCLRPLAPCLAAPGGPLIWNLGGHEDAIWGVAITADGQRAASVSSDQTLKVWDLVLGRLEQTLEGHSDWINAVALTPDGRRAVSASNDRTVKVWDLTQKKLHKTFRGHTDKVTSVAITSDGRCAVSGSEDRTLRVWDLRRNALSRTLKGHGAKVSSVAITQDGRRAVSASHDGVLKVWNLRSHALERTLEAHSAERVTVAVTADGKYAMSGTLGLIRFRGRVESVVRQRS